MKILILEDSEQRNFHFKEQLRQFEYTITETAQEAIEELKTNRFGLIFLDHDLGGEVYVDTRNTNTGSEVARWLVASDTPRSVGIIIHSMNLPAAREMEAVLRGGGFIHTTPYPYIQLINRILIAAEEIAQYQ